MESYKRMPYDSLEAESGSTPKNFTDFMNWVLNNNNLCSTYEEPASIPDIKHLIHFTITVSSLTHILHMRRKYRDWFV